MHGNNKQKQLFDFVIAAVLVTLFYGIKEQKIKICTTFVNAGRDSEKASEIAGENISERLSEFKSKPLEFVDFAKNKITTQWCEPTFQTFWMLQAMDNHAEWSKVAESIEKGKANKIIFVIMKLYLIFIWLGNLAYLIAKRKQLTIWNLLLQVAVLGGFIFHFLWEGKALYIMPYYVISFVAGVQGMYMLYEKIKIDEQTGEIYIEKGHKITKGSTYKVSVCAKNMYNEEGEVGLVKENAYEIKVVAFIAPFEEFYYGTNFKYTGTNKKAVSEVNHKVRLQLV